MGVSRVNKLNELIHKLRPDKVDYISIGSLITRIREKGSDDPNVRQVYVVSNTQGMVKAEEYRENTIHSEDTSNYTIVRENMIAYNPSRLNIGSIARLKCSEAGLVSPMYVVFSVNSQKIMYEYFDHIIKSSFVASKINSLKEEGARFRFEFSRWDRIIIPVPPLPVQKEIVRILENFTELTAALIAELTARKKQYEYCREKILSRTNNAEQFALQDIVADSCSISYGIVQTGDDVENGIPVVRPVDLADKIVSLRGLKKVEPSIAEPYKRTILKGGDLLLCVRGTTGVISIASDELKGCNVSRGIVPLTFKSTVCPQYIYYQFLSQGIQKEIESKTRGAALKQINMEDLRQIRFPVPTLEVQQQIVSILDRFDALCNDITSGLPAEIEARRKQYEYYRDKLLTFKPLP